MSRLPPISSSRCVHAAMVALASAGASLSVAVSLAAEPLWWELYACMTDLHNVELDLSYSSQLIAVRYPSNSIRTARNICSTCFLLLLNSAMRLLSRGQSGTYSLTDDLISGIPPYVILSHRWGPEEVSFDDLRKGSGKSKAGWRKVAFCANRAESDGYRYFWVDSCCIDKSNSSELQEAINSMFGWYQRAGKCYAYLSDITTQDGSWQPAFQTSEWFTRGWTLQELLAPPSVDFFSKEGMWLGDKKSLEHDIHQRTGIPLSALQGTSLSHFSIDEKFVWAESRQTTREEDKAYSLLGIFGVHIPLIYGEGEMHAVRRLRAEISKCAFPDLT